MPPLVCLGRRWRTGSDDFVLSGLLFGVCQAAIGVTSAAMLGWHGLACKIDVADLFAADPAASASGTLPPHVISLLDRANSDRADEGIYSMADNALLSLRLQSGAYLLSGVLLLALAFFSSRGRIMEYHRRATTVPIFLYLSFLGLIAVTALSVAVAVFIYGPSDRLAPCRVDGAYHGTRTRAISHLQCVLGFFPLVLFFVLFFASFDPYGHETYSEANSHTYADLWDSRFGWLICRCFRRDNASEEAFKDIASIFSNIFQGVDLVPSDIAAGMVLVRGHQHRILGRGIEGKTYPPSAPLNTNCCSCCVTVEERVSRQSRFFPPMTEELRSDIEILYRYRRFFMATYGWALAIFKDPKEAIPMICCNPCFYCRDPRWAHAKGEWCMCDSNILLQIGGLTEDDVIVTDFRNGLYQSPHFVVIDQSVDRPEFKSVVVGVRGSMSINDALTDMVATPAEITFESEAMRTRFAHTGPCFVHGGMLKTTENVLANLEATGVLKDLTEGKYRDLRLVLVGHSLGAGAVVILSILIHDRYPSLVDRLTCVAYAPPGGLLTRNLSDFTATYVVGGFFGVDVVPRLAVHTIEDLRTSIIDAVCAADEPKAAVFCKIMNPTKTHLLSNDQIPPAELVRARDKLLKSGVSPSVLQRATLTTLVSSCAVTTPLMSEAGRAGATPPYDGTSIVVVEPNVRTPLSPMGGATDGTLAGGNHHHGRTHSGQSSICNFSARHTVAASTSTGVTDGRENQNPQGGRGPLSAPPATATLNPNRVDRTDSSALRSIKLFPPGRLVHFAKAITRDTKCLFGAWNWSRQEYYIPIHIGVEAVQEIVCCPQMVTDHFPNNLLNVIENCQERLSAGGLDGFFGDGVGGARVAVQPVALTSDEANDNDNVAHMGGAQTQLPPLNIERPSSPNASEASSTPTTSTISMAALRGGGRAVCDPNCPFPSSSPRSPYPGGLSTIAYRFPSSSANAAGSFSNIAPSTSIPPVSGGGGAAYGGVAVTSRQGSADGSYAPYRAEDKDPRRR